MLYLLGVAHWTLFLERHGLGFEALDWKEQHQYHSVLSRAVEEGRVPWHVDKEFHGTDRFLASPQLPLSPQILLLPWFGFERYVLFNALLLYSIGFWGSVALSRRYSLSLASSTALILLVHFNGHLTAHLAVGHVIWLGTHLFPWLLLVICRVAEDQGSPRSPAWAALLLLALFLQGHFHAVLWWWFLLGLLALWKRGVWLRFSALTVGLSALLCLGRLVPAVITYRDAYVFQGGFPTLLEMARGLVEIRPLTRERIGTALGEIPVWELDHYVGPLGLAFLLYFGVWSWFRDRGGRVGEAHLQGSRVGDALLAPLATLAVLSMSMIYGVFHTLPLFGAERVTARFLILPLVAGALLAAIRLQHWLTERHVAGRPPWWLLLGLFQGAAALGAHSRVWAVSRIVPTARELDADLSLDFVSRADPLYRQALVASAAVSVATLLALVLALLLRRKPKTEAAEPI